MELTAKSAHRDRVRASPATIFCPRVVQVFVYWGPINLGPRTGEGTRPYVGCGGGGRRFHEIPGFAILHQPALLRFRADTNRIAALDDGGWENVPDIFWKDVGDERINLIG
jgi:hypothetical protein